MKQLTDKCVATGAFALPILETPPSQSINEVNETQESQSDTDEEVKAINLSKRLNSTSSSLSSTPSKRSRPSAVHILADAIKSMSNKKSAVDIEIDWTQRAMTIIYNEYAQLTPEKAASAMQVIQNPFNAKFFAQMRSGEVRDIWFEREIAKLT